MDTDSAIMSISRHREKVSKYNEDIHKKQSKINSNNRNIMDYKSKISKTKSITTIKSYYNKIASLESANAKLQKEIGSLQRQVMSNQREANRLEKQVLNNNINESHGLINDNTTMIPIDYIESKEEKKMEENSKTYIELVSDFCKNIKRNGLITKYGKVTDINDSGNQGGNGRILFGILNNHEVAIKVLYNNESGKINRFFDEFLNVFMSLQKSKGVVELYLYEEVEYDGQKVYYIIMKKYKGNLLKNKPEVNEKNIVKLFYDLCSIIEHVHKANIVHRDIKPENILLDKDNEIFLSDFGIAYFDPEEYQNTGHTLAKELLGNRKFSAPEQANKGTEPHVTMDIYALGQIIQWFVTGDTHSGTGRIKLTSEINGNMIFGLDKIIDKCIRYNPMERYQSIDEIYSDLREYNIKEVNEVKKDVNISGGKYSKVEKNDLGFGHKITII